MTFPTIPYIQDPAQYVNTGVFAQIQTALTSVTNPDTSEDVLQTFTLPKNTLSRDGQIARLRAWGTKANNADVKTLKLYIGGTGFSANLTASTATAWYAELELVRTGAKTQRSSFRVLDNNATLSVQQATTGTDDLSTALIAKVTATAGAASDVTCTIATVEFLG